VCAFPYIAFVGQVSHVSAKVQTVETFQDILPIFICCLAVRASRARFWIVSVRGGALLPGEFCGTSWLVGYVVEICEIVLCHERPS
jgi:hypothetical protein